MEEVSVKAVFAELSQSPPPLMSCHLHSKGHGRGGAPSRGEAWALHKAESVFPASAAFTCLPLKILIMPKWHVQSWQIPGPFAS